jgi:hypothetical protein
MDMFLFILSFMLIVMHAGCHIKPCMLSVVMLNVNMMNIVAPALQQRFPPFF